jgi:hypothetical protein
MVISGTSLLIKTTGPAMKDQLPFCLCSSKFSSSSLPSNFKHCQPHKCSSASPTSATTTSSLPGVAPLPPAPQPLYRPPQIRKRVRAPPDLPPIQEEEDRPDQKLQRLDPGGRQIHQEHQGLDPAPQHHPEPQHPKVDPDEPAGAGADQELGVAFEKLAITPPSARRPGPLKISPPRSPPGTPPKPGAANPFAALLPGAQEPGPPSERTRQMRKELEKTLLQRLAEEAAAKRKKLRKKRNKK